ncbi:MULTISPECIES: GDP-mannose mannosyl hydrolase [Pseudoalteromonas]|uniref:ADP-ribose pyrophosphatase n=1 Tax=Pseudoalteromonas luteoviolacea (strain 2ta16) TaxID=1353533 RepID=V4HWD6_PSEL2|nr:MULTISPECIES: GDP-mannose mannosyl hydrolase [Pseudoalteromonas]ESP95135.1 ADP-ribose pyrophosphatase [Pseudoalteromonas luteoviolacea 2ta16]KZN42307.1 GDP-mannose mannosyl hydrolase NudD [Pseudoalteromonas luteoviolacea NCIMB 1944]MCG7547195.1 GDP-mannose mannosyl hydrolase [Pseudoalteromonas sp. Of7M-16]
MFLDKNTFSTVIESTPLVSIDLVILNQHGEALLGQRLNRPAQGNWFVPGGRIQKDESLANAFERLTLEELGEQFSITESELLGPYDHFYHDNVFGQDFSTHYVAIAYVLRLNKQLEKLPVDVQHGKYQWFNVEQLLMDPKVHKHTKWYFEKLQNTQE